MKTYWMAIVVLAGLSGATMAFATDTTAELKITTIAEFGKDVDWHSGLNLIASAKQGRDGYYDVFTMKPDGSNVQVLTQGLKGCPQKNNGNVAFHPSGRLLVFTAQDERLPDDDPVVRRAAIPGSGLGSNLGILDVNRKTFQQLTDYPLAKPLRAVIHPQFSKDGKRLAWAERVRRGSSFGGGWVMKLADVRNDADRLSLQNIKTVEPGDQDCFYEVHDFSSDGSKLLFSGNLRKGQVHTGLDIYELNLPDAKVIRLTSTDNDWDEHAHYSPDGRQITWMSSKGLGVEYERKGEERTAWELDMSDVESKLKTELWIMNAEGTNQRQLTHFNTPGFTEHVEGANCIVADSAWSPDGKSIVACVFTMKGKRRSSRLVRIDLL